MMGARVLELLCAMARAHGNLTWVSSGLRPEDQTRTNPYHQLTVTAAGTGIDVPVR